MKRVVIILSCLLLCVGCSSTSSTDGLISYTSAKEKIINNNAILIDVRTTEEYDENHISGAKLLTLDTISEETASSIIDSYDTEIIVYCRSGARSSEAKIKLEELGYKNVYDLGSIDNWKE